MREEVHVGEDEIKEKSLKEGEDRKMSVVINILKYAELLDPYLGNQGFIFESVPTPQRNLTFSIMSSYIQSQYIKVLLFGERGIKSEVIPDNSWACKEVTWMATLISAKCTENNKPEWCL